MIISKSLDNVYFYFIKCFIYLFLEQKGGRKRWRETSVCSCLSCAPYWRPGPQPRHVLWLGIELAALWFAVWHSTTESHQPGLNNMFILLFINLPYVSSWCGHWGCTSPKSWCLPFVVSLIVKLLLLVLYWLCLYIIYSNNSYVVFVDPWRWGL